MHSFYHAACRPSEWRRLVRVLFIAAALLAGLAVPVTAQDPEGAAPETIGNLTLTLDAGGHTGTIVKVQFTPEGRLITSSQDGSIRVWDVETGRTRKVLHVPGRLSQTAVAVSRDGKTLAAAYSRYET